MRILINLSWHVMMSCHDMSCHLGGRAVTNHLIFCFVYFKENLAPNDVRAFQIVLVIVSFSCKNKCKCYCKCKQQCQWSCSRRPKPIDQMRKAGWAIFGAGLKFYLASLCPLSFSVCCSHAHGMTPDPETYLWKHFHCYLRI